MKKFLKKISKVIIIYIFAISNRFEDLLSDIQNEAQLKIIFTMKNLYYLRKAVCCKSLPPSIRLLMKSIFTLVLCFLALTSFSQNELKELKARLVDENGAAVQFANVSLKSADNDSIIAGTSSDENGNFIFNVEEGRYILLATAIGYERLSIYCRPSDLGDLTMPQTSEILDDVVIQGSRIEETPQHFVILPDPTEVEISGKGINYLNMLQLPGLKVNMAKETISIDGGTPVFQINGKEVSYQRFINVSSEKIKRVEYSNNPGIRYLDKGATGIINIVLKEVEDGGSISANGKTAFNTGFVDGYVLGTYNRGKSEILIQYNVSHRNYDDVPYELTDKYINENRMVEREQTMKFPFYYTTHNIMAEYTYQANDSTFLIVSLRDNINNNNWTGDGMMMESDNGIIDTITMNRIRRDKANMPVLDLYFSRRMRNFQKIELNVVGQYSKSNYENKLTYDYISDTLLEEYPTYIENHGYSVSGEAMYTKSFDNSELYLGLQYQHNFAHNDYVVYEETSSMNKDNVYAYSQYVTMLGKRASLVLGTGMKIFVVDDGMNKQNYIKNLSTVKLNWIINRKLSMSAVANLTPNLPSLGALSTIMQRTDDVEANVGNPDLKPYYSLLSKLVLVYNSQKSLYAIATAGYSYLFNPIIFTYHYDPGLNLFINSPHNSDYFNSMYFNAELGMRKLFKFLYISLNGTLSRDESKGIDFHHEHVNFYSSVDVQAVWNKFNIGCEFDITPKISLYGENLSYKDMSQDIYAQYKLKNLYITLTWHCPFNKEGYKYDSEGLSAVHPYRHVNWTANNGNMLVLGLSWNINYGKSFSKGRKSLNNGGYDDGMIKPGE